MSSPNDGTLITSELTNTAEQIKFSEAVTCQFIFASRLIQQKANLKYIQEQMRHGSIRIFMDIYRRLFEGNHCHFVRCLDELKWTDSATQPQPAFEDTHTAIR